MMLGEASTSPLLPESSRYGWEFAGWGSTERIADVRVAAISVEERNRTNGRRLGTLAGACFGAIETSAASFYAVGLTAMVSGKWTPVSFVVAFLLQVLLRKIHAYNGRALPLNGGTYTLLLNATSKWGAAVIGCFTLFSYIAAAAVCLLSAVAHITYLASANVFLVSGLLLVGATTLSLVGRVHTARLLVLVASAHSTLLVIFMGILVAHVATNPGTLSGNWSSDAVQPFGGFFAIFAGYCGTIVGFTGFETSSNIVEVQKPIAHSRSLWLVLLTAALNPIVAFLVTATVPMSTLLDPLSALVLLPLAARTATPQAPWLAQVMAIDGAIALICSLMSLCVGVQGLLRRMALDRVLPQRLLYNPRRPTSVLVTVVFAILCFTMVLLAQLAAQPMVPFETESAYTPGAVEPSAPQINVWTPAAVYGIGMSFTMFMGAVGSMTLKYKRGALNGQAMPWPVLLLAAALSGAALGGCVIGDADSLQYFVLYFTVLFVCVWVMFLRVRVWKAVLKFMPHQTFAARIINDIRSQCIVFFTKDGFLPTMNKAVLYIKENELTHWIRIVHVYQSEQDIPRLLEDHVRLLDKTYPKIKIDLVLVKGEFDPSLIDALSQRLAVAKNFMFIACPTDRFAYHIGELGGVRVITH